MQVRPKRGRPPEADPHQVLVVALRLFERKGFDRVTMAEIADAASVSRRTLFRLFPSKSDLVWGGLDEVRAAVALQAAQFTGRLRLSVLIDGLIAPVLQQLEDPEAARMARRRLRLIAATPALLNHRTLHEIEEVVATVVAAGAPRGGPPASLVARTLVAAAFAAILWWAEHGEGTSALETVRSALEAMALSHGE
jgi:AcrR family transcriptional regulator